MMRRPQRKWRKEWRDQWHQRQSSNRVHMRHPAPSCSGWIMSVKLSSPRPRYRKSTMWVVIQLLPRFLLTIKSWWQYSKTCFGRLTCLGKLDFINHSSIRQYTSSGRPPFMRDHLLVAFGAVSLNRFYCSHDRSANELQGMKHPIIKHGLYGEVIERI